MGNASLRAGERHFMPIMLQLSQASTRRGGPFRPNLNKVSSFVLVWQTDE